MNKMIDQGRNYIEFLKEVGENRIYFSNLYELCMQEHKADRDIAALLRIPEDKIAIDRERIENVMRSDGEMFGFLRTIGKLSDKKH